MQLSLGWGGKLLGALLSVLQATPAAILLVDEGGIVTFANDAAHKLLELGHAQAHGRRAGDILFHTQTAHPSANVCAVSEVLRDGRPRAGTVNKVWGKNGDGPTKRIEFHVAPLGDGAGASAVITLRDVSERVEQQQRLERLSAIIEDTPDIISTSDVKGNILYYNKAGRSLLGIGSNDDISTLRVGQGHPDWAKELIVKEAMPTASREGVWYGETAVLDPEGKEIPVLQVLVAHKNADGEVEYYSTILRDISERKRMEERLNYLANHDSLTGVVNRVRFQEHLRHELDMSRTYGTVGALLYIDFDNFKDVNDSLGHHAGDEMLQRITRAVEAELREQDTLARLGGDEFAVLLPRTTADNAVRVGERLLRRIAEEKVCLGDSVLRMAASIGIATFPAASAGESDVLIQADLAMYAAKQSGGHRVVVFDPTVHLRGRGQQGSEPNRGSVPLA